MAKISLKKDYMDGNVLYGKDLNPNFETIETTINGNDDAQAETNAEVEEALTQLSSDMTQAQTDISSLQENVTHLESDITSGDSSTLESAKSYTDTKLQDYAKTTDLPTKISQLENDDNTVKDASYVHTDNNYSTEEKNKLAGLSNYVLPVASADTLGGIKVGDGLGISSFGDLILKKASTTQLGGVKAGEGVNITADGTLNVTGGGGSTGDGIPTITGTQEDPIPLYNFTVGDRKVPIGLAYISGYTKEISTSEANDNYNRNLLYTSSNGFQFIGPYYERYDNGSLNLVFWFRPRTVNNTPGFFTEPFVKYSANEIITNTEQGYVTPKAVYDYVGALTSLNTTDKTSIVNAINELVNSAGTPGEDGATFTPSVDDSGNLSWTNDKNLPNPDPVNIKGPKGDTGEQGEQGDPGPAGANGVTPTIGENGNWYLGETDTGKPSRGEKGPKGNTGEQGPQGLPGPTGPGVPTGGTTGQVLSKSGDGDYETEWKDVESSGGGVSRVYYLNATAAEPINLIDDAYLKYGIYICDSSDKSSSAYTNRGAKHSGNSVEPTYPFIRLVLPYNRTDDDSDVSNLYSVCIIEMYGGPYFTMHGVYYSPQSKSWGRLESGSSNVFPITTFHQKNTERIASASLTSTLANAIDGKGSGRSIALSDLQTTDKSSLIAAINELNTRLAALENPTE